MRAVRRFLLVTAVPLVLGLAIASPSGAATPEGYELCGYKDYVNGGWTFDPADGASTVLYARGVSCRSAKRNYGRLRYGHKPPYRPFVAGYRCRELKRGYEFTDVRCLKRGSRSRGFRYQSGS